MASSPSLVGSLPKVALGLNESLTPLPDVQPSAIWKALGHTFLGLMLKGVNDLSELNRALFIASLGQPGIPEGTRVPKEVTNYQLFLKADAVQYLDKPVYALDDQPSYYELLYRYLRYVEPAKRAPKLTKGNGTVKVVREDLIRAEVKKDQAWEVARHAYEAPTPESFIETLNQDKAYLTAYQAETDLQERYKAQYNDPEMQDVYDHLDILKSANDRLVYHAGNNMPCIALSEDQVRSLGALKADPKDVYYRPAHSIADYERQYNFWVEHNKATDGPYSISLSDQADLTWKALGHPSLDDDAQSPVAAAAVELYSHAKINMWFTGGPAVTVDVDRDAWDVKGIRKLGQLSADAPGYLQQPFCKTTRLLLAWGVRLELRIPNVGVESRKKALLDSLRVPFVKVSGIADGSEDVYTYTAGDDTYPIVLAVLAAVI